jgi:hypothetical protein
VQSPEYYDDILEVMNGTHYNKKNARYWEDFIFQRYLLHLVQKVSQQALETPFPSIIYAMSVAFKTVFYNLRRFIGGK